MEAKQLSNSLGLSQRRHDEFLTGTSVDGPSDSISLDQSDRESIDEMGAKLCLVNTKAESDWSQGYALDYVCRDVLDGSLTGPLIDFGTARGFSALVMARFLEKHDRLNTVISLDILPHDVNMFWGSPVDLSGPISRSSIWEGYEFAHRVVFLEGPISHSLARLGVKTTPLAFLDSQHSFSQVALELRWVIDHQLPGGVIVLDDFGSGGFNGVKDAATQLLDPAGYSRTHLFGGAGKKIAVWVRR